MVRNLIRNGGFERADTGFWTAFDAKVFTAQTLHKYKGTYAGLLICNGANDPYAMSNDFIELSVGEIAFYEAWVKASGVYIAELRVDYYDEGLSLIETVSYGVFNPGTTEFKQVLEVISGIEGAIYCRPYIYLDHSNEDDWMAIDNVTMYKFKPEDVLGGVRLMDYREGLSVANTYFSPWIVVAPFKEATFILNVLHLTGSSDLLNVKIVSKSNFDSYDYAIATFNQVNGGARQQVLVVTAGLGTKIRVEATLAGSSLNCDYKVEAILKR